MSAAAELSLLLSSGVSRALMWAVQPKKTPGTCVSATWATCTSCAPSSAIASAIFSRLHAGWMHNGALHTQACLFSANRIHGA